ncbi:MAG: hypothetical protein EXQ90_09070, partial [Rhodospirillales bacterium]|nr:hypothetical protein [Rhodospirillales bacterium]
MAASPLLPRSARTGIGWPAIPSYRDAAGLALARQLEDSEWWAADRLMTHQLRQLEIVIAHARASVPFYRNRLDHVGPLKPGELTLEGWQKIPVLTRRDIQSAGEALVSRAIPKDHLPTHEHSTTGSTGRPVVILSTPVTSLFYLAIHLRKYRWHRSDLDATQVKIKILTDSEAARVKDGTPLSWAPVYNRRWNARRRCGTRLARDAQRTVRASLPISLHLSRRDSERPQRQVRRRHLDAVAGIAMAT